MAQMVSFRLATFNIENLDDAPAVKPPFAERLAALRPELEALAADILCLQEVNAQTDQPHGVRRLRALERLLAGTPYAGFHRAATLSPSGRGLRDVHNLVILSRFPVLEIRQIAHDFVPPLSWRPLTAVLEGTTARAGKNAVAEPGAVVFDRPLLYARIDLGQSRPLHVLNLHLRAPIPSFLPGTKLKPWAWKSVGSFAEGMFLADLKRAAQALEARLFLETLFAAASDPLIAVAGDFNAKTDELPTQILRASVLDTGNPKLKRNSLLAVEARLPEAKRFSVRHAGLGLMLDHLLVSRALYRGFRGAEILNADLPDELVAFVLGQHPAAGCHAPLVASFTIA
jgi:endonuclease/exonuclease/phosphatase family metal-dependent hydrolase